MSVEKRILLIDDDQINSITVSERLKKRGFEVYVLNDPRKYKDVIKEFSPNLILLDIMMPHINGLEILVEIRSQADGTTLPIIMLTAKESPADIVETLNKGANDYLTKPINIDVATARIRTQLDHAKLTKDSLIKGQLEGIHALVVTYNHELNTPLTVAMGCVALIKAGREKTDTSEKLNQALIRIGNIVAKIKTVAEAKSVDYDEYSDDSNVKMLKIS